MKRVLVALRPGQIDDASIARVRYLAESTEIELLLFSGVYDDQVAKLARTTATISARLQESMLAAIRDQLQLTRQQLVDVCATVNIQVEWCAFAPDGILNCAAEFAADLIVLTGHRRSSFTRLMPYNTDWEVMRRATVPVLLAQDSTFVPYKSILVAVDPTHPQAEHTRMEDRMIDAAMRFAGFNNATVYLAHAYPDLDDSSDWSPDDRRSVLALATRHGIREANIRRSPGRPRDVIPQIAADVNADLAVLGAVSRSAIRQVLVGRTTEHVLDDLECDVVTLSVAATPG